MTGDQPTWLAPDSEVRLRRMLLAASPDNALVQDRIDCIELASAAGLDAAAASLRAMVALELGSVRAATLPLGINAGAGRADALVRADSTAEAQSIDLAVVELRALMQRGLVLQQTPEPCLQIVPDEPPIGFPQTAEARERLLALAAEVGGTLRTLGSMCKTEISSILAEFSSRLAAVDPIRLEEYLDLESGLFADVFVTEQLRRFCVVNADVISARVDDQPLVESAMMLHPGALGAYFGNVQFVIRNARDVFALIDAAASGTASFNDIEDWSIILSAHLNESTLVDLTDELGDRGMVRPIRSILHRYSRTRSYRHHYTGVRRVRDVALDIGALDVATEAQRLLSVWRSSDPIEWKLLGYILATANNVAAADRAFSFSAALSGYVSEASSALDSLRTGTLPAVAGGFETSLARRQARQARMAAAQRSLNRT